MRVNGGLVAVVGAQGVGKSAVLLRLFHLPDGKRLLINWSEPNEQMRDLLRHDLIISPAQTPFANLKESFESTYRTLLRAEIGRGRMVPIRLPKGRSLPADLRSLDVEWAEKQLGRSRCAALQGQSWLMVLRRAEALLIDLPDYARTDKRFLTRDLNEIYRLWNRLHDYPNPPTFVIAIQKEMIHGHFFFDKMEKVEIRPLTPEQMKRSYVTIFGGSYPFDEAALLELGGLSRGIYRRFKRYISLTIRTLQWHLGPSELITPGLVRKVITSERLAEDLDTELEELFPKHIDSRRDAARIIHHLRAGPLDQTKLGEALDIPAYTLSRLLSKMEPRYVTRKIDGSHKIVSVAQV
jgi:hypothetical protein